MQWLPGPGGWTAPAAAWPGADSFATAGYRAGSQTQVLDDGRTVIAARDGLGGDHGAPYGDGTGGYRRKRWISLFAVAVLVFAVAGTARWWFTMGRYTSVPAVAGMTESAAVNTLRADGFTVRMGTAVADNSAKAGTVARTVPAAGGRISKGAAITLIPSAGPRMIKVPNVAGQQLGDAEQALRNIGLTPGGVHKEPSSSVDDGIVISTSPAAGLSQPQTTPVDINVSEGPPLPNFVGQDQQSIQQWAAAERHHAQCSAGQQAARKPQGIITRQSPAPGTPISDNETVTHRRVVRAARGRHSRAWTAWASG